MAGYSGTPLARKLGIKPGARLGLVNAPPEAAEWLAPLPEGVARCGPRARNLDAILCFVDSAAALERRFGAQAARLRPAGGLWIAWPKQASGVPTDLDENVVRRVGLAGGLVDNKVCAVSDVWSALRFVYRLKDRKG